MAKNLSHGTFRTPRRGDDGAGSGFRILAGLVGLVILVGVIAIALAVLKLRKEFYDLQGSMAPRTGFPAGPQDFDSALEGLRKELSESLTITTDSVDQHRRESMEDRKAIKESLARLMYQHEADASELSALLGGMTDEQRRAIMLALGETDPEAGHRSIRNGNLPEGGPETNGSRAGVESEGPEGDPKRVIPLVRDPDPRPTPGPTPVPTPPDPGPEAAPPPAEPEYQSYKVVRGDTLSLIARKHGVTAEAIMKANRLRNPNRIGVGQVLKIPAK